MGLIWSRFRTKLSTKDVLEDIEKKLKSIEEFQQDTLERKKRVVRRLLVVTVVFYLLASAAFMVITPVRQHQLYFFAGLVIFALLVWASHILLRWYYTRKMQRNSQKSVELRKKKQKILEEVMDTETYKVAKEILDKFGDKAPQKPAEVKPPQAQQSRPSRQLPGTQTPGTELRQRHFEHSKSVPARSNMPVQSQSVPTHMNATPTLKIPNQLHSVQRPVAMNYGHAPLRPLPRPILPRERGIMDRMMDLIVGDGPNQRYALICRHCGGHNGMALQEEFEFVSHYCCYCFQFNPARKQRPMGPRLPVAPTSTSGPTTPAPSSVSGAEKTDAEKSEPATDKSDTGSEKETEVHDESASECSSQSHQNEPAVKSDETAQPKAEETSDMEIVPDQDELDEMQEISDENDPGLR